MITQTLINFFVTMVSFILDFLPDVDTNVSDTITSSVTGFRDALTNINWFFPVDTTLQFLSTIFVIESLIFLWKLIRYIGGIFTLGALK